MQPAERPSGSGRLVWKIVIGCGAAFGLVLLVAIALGLYGVYWCLSPGRQMPTALAVGPRSVGVIRLERGDSDRGIQELALSVFHALQRAQLEADEGEVPPFLQSMRRLQLAQQPGGLGLWIPSEATLSIEAAPQGQTRVVGAVNMRSLVRPIGFVLGRSMRSDPKTRVVVHGGHEILLNHGGPAVCFAEGSVLFGSGDQELGSALDRWSAAPAGEPRLPASLQGLSGQFDVYGAFDRAEESSALLGILISVAIDSDHLELAKQARSAVSGLKGSRFGIDVVTADELKLRVELSYADPESAQAARERLDGALASLSPRVSQQGMSLELKPVLEGPRLALDARLSGVESGIHNWLAELLRRDKRLRRER